MWFSIAVNTVIAAAKEAVKNPNKKAAMKAKLLELRDAINAAYPGE